MEGLFEIRTHQWKKRRTLRVLPLKILSCNANAAALYRACACACACAFFLPPYSNAVGSSAPMIQLL